MKEKPRKKHRQQRFEVLPGEGRRFSFRTLRQVLVFYFFLFVALAVIAQLGYHWLGGQYLAWRLQVVAAEPGVMDQKVKAEGMVTRREEVIKAPVDGIVLRLATAEERVAAGTELVKIGVVSQSDFQSIRGYDGYEPDEDLFRKLTDYWQQIFNAEGEGNPDQREGLDQVEGEQEDIDYDDLSIKEIVIVYNDNPGYLSFYLDGGEELAGPVYQPASETGNVWEGSSVSEGDLIEAGEPLLKIVDNWQWFYSVILPMHPGQILTGLTTVEIEFDFAPDEFVQASLYHSEIDDSANSVHLTYVIKKQVPGFDRARWTEASLLYQRQQGIIVPVAALVEKEREIGVYLNRGGRVVFQPVTIVEREEEKVMVEGLAPLSLVISRPDLVKEGQRLN